MAWIDRVEDNGGKVEFIDGGVIVHSEPDEESYARIYAHAGQSDDFLVVVKDSMGGMIQDGLDFRSAPAVLKEYFSSSRGLKCSAALSRGFFDGLGAAVETMKGVFAEETAKVDQTEMSAELAAVAISEQLAARQGFEDARVYACEAGRGEVRYAVIDTRRDEAAEVTVTAGKGEDGVSISPVGFECDNGDDTHDAYHVELGIVAACAGSAKMERYALSKGIEVVKVVRERRYRSGYILRDEVWKFNGEETLMERVAYNPSGDYIGDSKEAYFLCSRKGISPEKSDPGHCVCSIGYSTKDKKWYGWSHRAICGFKIGDMLYEEGACGEDVPYRKCGKKPIETLQEAKQAAINFARSVS